jgi:4-amino-4-deoxy-L-arabinose transferase-like glycosyltransferase
MVYYLPWARASLFQIEPFHGPGYPAAVKLANFALGDIFAAAKMVSVVAGLVVVLSSWFLFRSMATIEQAACATALAALNPVLLMNANTIMSDMTAAALFLAACAVVIAPKQARDWHWLLAGSLVGAAYLTRYSYLAAVVLPLLAIGLRRVSRKRAVSTVLLFACGFLTITLPWMIWLTVQKGSPMWSLSHMTMAFKLYGQEGGFNNFRNVVHFRSLGEVIRYDPRLFVSSFVRSAVIEIPRASCYLIPATGPGILFVGLFVSLWQAEWRRWLFYLAVGAHCAVLALVWVDPRYLLAVVPMLCLVITDLLFAIPLRLTKLPAIGSFRLLAGLLFSAPILLVSLNHCRPEHLRQLFSNMAPEYKAAADFIAERKNSNDRVFATKAHLAYLSGTRWLDFRALNVQDSSIADFGRLVEEQKPRFVVMDEIYGCVQFPRLCPMLEQDAMPPSPQLERILWINTPRRLAVYEFKGDTSSAPPLKDWEMSWQPNR